jgi:hypothetical protein
MKKFIKLIGFILVSIIAVVAIYKIHSTYETKKSFTLLKNVNYFCIDGSQNDDKRTDALHAYKVLFNSKNGEKHFLQLLEEASIEGRLYALCGLYYKNHEYYKKTLGNFVNKKIIYNRLAGGRQEADTIANIIKIKSEDVVQLSSTSQTLTEWRGQSNDSSYVLDFAGGGIPAALREYIDK